MDPRSNHPSNAIAFFKKRSCLHNSSARGGEIALLGKMGKTFGEEDRAGAGRPSGRTDRGRQASEYGALSMRRGEEEEREERGDLNHILDNGLRHVRLRQPDRWSRVEWSGAPACLLPAALPLLFPPSLLGAAASPLAGPPARPPASRQTHPSNPFRRGKGREGESGAKMESAALCATWSVGRSFVRSVGP